MRLVFRLFPLFCIMALITGGCMKRYDDEAAEAIGSMTIEQKIGQMIMPAVPGQEINDEAAELVKRYMPGGLILFGYNIDTGRKLKGFIEALQGESMAASGVPLFVSVDQEGGRVRRIIDGVTQFPGNLAAGIAGDSDLVSDWARILGIQLRMLGVNMNLAPVVDVNNNPDNPVINSRSFGSDPRVVADMGAAYIRGLQKSGCIAVAKHFPGHGDTNRDSHVTLPVINYPMDRLRRVELYPFHRAIDEKVECVMTAHISYPAVLGSGEPATISPRFLTGILRDEIGFRGVVITDDMEMNAMSQSMDMGEAAVRSVLAGTDIVLISTYGGNVPAIVNSLLAAVKSGRLPVERIDASVKRILELKFRYRIADYREGRVHRSPQFAADDAPGWLARADEVNEKISGGAVHFHGDRSLMAAPARIVLYTDNAALREICASMTRPVQAKPLETFRADIASGACAGIVACVHADGLDAKAMGELAALASGNGVALIALSTGNPFPVARSSAFGNMLFTFSNTETSLRRAAACLAGDFAPKFTINCDLGIAARR